jgi:hypothetical protein
MGSTRESPERRLIVISGLAVRRRPAQRLGISAFHDYVDACRYGMLLCTGPPGRSWAGQRFIGFTELLASHDHDRFDHTTRETEVSRTIDIKAVAECPFGCPLLTQGQRVEGWIAWPSTFLGEPMQLS